MFGINLPAKEQTIVSYMGVRLKWFWTPAADDYFDSLDQWKIAESWIGMKCIVSS
jgi:hypothetical protein